MRQKKISSIARYMAMMILLILSFSISTQAYWNIGIIDRMEKVGRYNCLAFDGNGNPCVSYYDDTNKNLKYSQWDGTAWQIQTVIDENQRIGRFTSLVFDSSGHAHVSCINDTTKDLIHTWWNGTTWQKENIVVEGGVGEQTCMKIDAADNLYISFFGHESEDLKYASYDGSVWQIETIDSEGSVGYCSSLVLDSLNRPHVAYYEFSIGYLKYAVKDSGTWQISTVDDTANVGISASLQLDSDDNPRIGYHDWENATLKYAAWSGSQWNIEVVDAVGQVGWASSLYLDSQEYPHISYQDLTNENLKYAFWDGNAWQIATIDDDGQVGRCTSLVLNQDDQAYICYRDLANCDLKVAWETAEAPPTPTPEPTPTAIWYSMTMEDTLLGPSELFRLERECGNPTTASIRVDEYIVLDILDQYWFWPSFTQSIDFQTWDIPAQSDHQDTILTFEWPSGAGSATGLKFWGAILWQDTYEFDMLEWGFDQHPSPFQLTSPAFQDGESIPVIHTCDGEDVSAPLEWANAPNSTQSFALIMEDLLSESDVWVHWVLYNIPAEATSLEQAVSSDPYLPDGSRNGENTWNRLGYRGPCPPDGTHHYVWTLYALDSAPDIPASSAKSQLLKEIEGHIIAQTELSGVYSAQ